MNVDPAILREHFIEFCNTKLWVHPYCVSLTLKQGMSEPHFHALTRTEASRTFTRFKSLVNYSIFGKDSQRRNLKLYTVASLENSPGERLHYHALIDCPPNLSEEKFKALIRTNWSKTIWGYNEADIKSAANPDGWLKYITKEKGLETIDLDNLVIPSSTRWA